jgi:hypothetical protein
MISKINSFAFIALLSMLSFTTVQAQRVELTATGGYQYWGSYKYSYYSAPYNYSGKVALGDGACYGGILGFEVSDQTFVELVYNHQDSRLVNKPNGYSPGAPTQEKLPNVGVNYFQLNGTRVADLSEKVSPFATFGAGAALFDPIGSNPSTGNSYSSIWKFAVNFGVGVKYYVSDKIGLRLGCAFWAPIQGVGLGVGVGTGGAYAGASAYTTVVQMNMSGGIIFRLQN